MTRQRGKPSSRWPSASPALDLVPHLLAWVGVLASLCLIVVSALLNYRMGFRSADTDLDGYIYGGGAAAGDIVKAIAPFMAAYAIKHRDWLTTATATTAFVIFTAYSFTAALGFAAEHRNNKAAFTLNGMESRQDLRGEKGRAEERLNQLGPQRSSAEVEAAIATESGKTAGPRNRTVKDISNNCALNRAATRTHCQTIATLGEELARAEEAERLSASITELRKKLASQNASSASTTADPQVDAVKHIASKWNTEVDGKAVGFWLSLLLALFVEFGSGLGLFIATTPWRIGKQSSTASPMPGEVDAFVMQSLEPDNDSEVRAGDLYAGYCAWCLRTAREPLPRGAFKMAFAEIARTVNLRNRIRRGEEIYEDVKLVP